MAFSKYFPDSALTNLDEVSSWQWRDLGEVRKTRFSLVCVPTGKG